MKYTIDDGERGISASTMCSALKEARIVSVRLETGKIRLTEACDECYSVLITREQLIDFANELIEIAQSPFDNDEEAADAKAAAMDIASRC